jgi:hypothetical protein
MTTHDNRSVLVDGTVSEGGTDSAMFNMAE